MTITQKRKRVARRVRRLSRQQSREMFDTLTRRYLGIGREEFVRGYEAGEYAEDTRAEVRHLVMLLPFGR